MMNLSLWIWWCHFSQMDRLVQSMHHLSGTWHLNFRRAFYMLNISASLCFKAAADRSHVLKRPNLFLWFESCTQATAFTWARARLAHRDEVRNAVKALPSAPPSPRWHLRASVCLNVLARCFTHLQLSGLFILCLRALSAANADGQSQQVERVDSVLKLHFTAIMEMTFSGHEDSFRKSLRINVISDV